MRTASRKDGDVSRSSDSSHFATRKNLNAFDWRGSLKLEKTLHVFKILVNAFFFFIFSEIKILITLLHAKFYVYFTQALLENEGYNFLYLR